MTIEDVGKFLESMDLLFSRFWIMDAEADLPGMIVPINLKEEDAFHLTIEEYLLALIAMVEELVSAQWLRASPLPSTNSIANSVIVTLGR